MHILITGATGFIGGHLCEALRAEGHRLTALVRDRKKARGRLGSEVELVRNLADVSSNTTIDAVINLAGASIAGGPWTTRRREVLLSSRIGTTEALINLCERLDTAPKVVISASAAGYYGNRGDDLLSENEPGQDIFMSRLCQQWEDRAARVGGSSARHVIARLGVVFGTDGGAFPQLSRSARFGVGVVLGDGQQYFPWVHLADVLAFFRAALNNDDFTGPYNVVAPNQLRQIELVEALAGQRREWLRLSMPAVVLRTLMGEMSDLFLKSQHMSAARLADAGFVFRYPEIAAALDTLMPSRPSE